MICYRRKCIFVHVPKTGGTSIENAIWGPDWSQRTTQQLWAGSIRPGFNKYQSGGLQHLLATQIRQEVGAGTFAACYRFSFVRNPWDKVVSQFHYLKTRPVLLKYMGLTRFSTFQKYLNILAGNHTRHVQSFEQWRFITDQDGQCLVNFVGKFENLAADFRRVAATLGLPSQELPHDMKSVRRRHYHKYYNRKRRQQVADIYARDIELFEYDF